MSSGGEGETAELLKPRGTLPGEGELSLSSSPFLACTQHGERGGDARPAGQQCTPPGTTP